MSYQPTLTPGLPIDRIPEPRRSVHNLMLATAMAADDEVDPDPGRFDPLLMNCLLLRRSDLVVAGTGCRRPLMLREFASACDYGRREGLIVRLGDDLIAGRSTFDVKLLSRSRMLCSYRLWRGDGRHPTFWLVPSAGEGPYLRFAEAGLEINRAAPFDTCIQRRGGLVRGANFLSIAGQGWF